MKSNYYEVTTANTTYYVRTNKWHGIDGITKSETIAYGGKYGVLYLTRSERPEVGVPLSGSDCTHRVRTSPVRAARRISFKEFSQKF